MNASRSSVWQSALRGMQKLGFRAKLGVLSLPLLLPLAGLMGLQWTQAYQATRVVDVRLQGARLLGALMEASAACGTPERAAALARTEALVQAMPAVGLKESWLAVHRSAASRPTPATPADGACNEERAALTALWQRANERSGLQFDSDPAVALRVSALTYRLPAVQDALLDARHHNQRLARGDDVDALARAAMRARAQSLAALLAQANARLDALERAGVGLPTAWNGLRQPGEDLVRHMQQTYAGDASARPDMDMEGEATRAWIGGQVLRKALQDGLEASLEERLAAERQALALNSAGALLLLVLVGLVWALVDRSIAGSLQVLTSQLDQLADGNLARRQPVRGADELARFGVLVDRTGDRMSALVSEIRTSAVRVGEAGDLLALQGQALARRTEAQVETMRLSVARVAQLGDGAAANADHIGEISGLAERMHDRVQESHATMEAAIAGMSELQDTARQVAEINGVIDDIAFQTSLVALNASVEAARAGESGRGFAVVAAEIRGLAQRCAESAAEVRDLVARTGDQVQTSTIQVGQVHQVLRALSGGADDMAGRLRQVGGASRAQGTALREIATDVAALQALAHENALAATSASAASNLMSAQSAALQASVSAVMLRQGSVDEARALAERGRERVAEVGWQRAVDEFNAPDGPFIDRDLYLFAFDSEGTYMACGRAPERVGTRLQDAPGVSLQGAEQLLIDGRAAAAGGGGWVDYEFVGLGDFDGAQAKSAWVVDLGDGAFMGCGVLRHGSTGAEQAPSAPRAEPALA